MNKCEQIERAVDGAERSSGHALALINALGNPSEWEYRGEVADAGNQPAECACGHPIRWMFPIYHATRSATHLGSTCVEHFAQLSPETGAAMLARLEQLNAELNAAKLAAKRAAAMAEVETVRAEFTAAYTAMAERYYAFRRSGLRAPRALWEAVESHHWGIRAHAPDYQRPSDYLKWYRKQLERVRAVAA